MWSFVVWVGFFVSGFLVWKNWPENTPWSGFWFLIGILFLVAMVLDGRQRA